MSGQPTQPESQGATSDGTRTRPPQPLPPSSWAFPSADQADEDGIVGIGADLDPRTLVTAYQRGIFPWPHGWPSLPWFSPDPRAVIRPETLHVSRSLQRTLRRSGWHTTCDAAFRHVIAGCASARHDGTWITPAMVDAYTRLHELGWAHSIEVWDDEQLVGGLYGVQVGAVFTGESMFSRSRDASKVAMCDLLDRFAEAGGHVLDAQLMTEHLASMGAVPVPRQQWLAELAELVHRPVRMLTATLPVARLARGRLEPI
ncbi:MAG: leucyl/phenylalanyl-tRNA--protein transferase [Nitriliruptorales bacterium]|nr:leucyl/phenylalanyl-tRNA--protein transferase [Nitriliruptorales bacterium]